MVASTTFPVFSYRLGHSVLTGNPWRHSNNQFYSLTVLASLIGDVSRDISLSTGRKPSVRNRTEYKPGMRSKELWSVADYIAVASGFQFQQHSASGNEFSTVNDILLSLDATSSRFDKHYTRATSKMLYIKDLTFISLD